jgi:transposase-like protein
MLQKRAIKQMHDQILEKQKLVEEVDALDVLIEKKTKIQLESKKQLDVWKKSFQASCDKLNSTKQAGDKKIMQDEKQAQEALKVNKELTEVSANLAKAKTKLEEARLKRRVAEDALNSKRKQLVAAGEGKASSPRPKQPPAAVAAVSMVAPKPQPLRGLCTFCEEVKDNLGVLYPCKHLICLPCFRDAKETSDAFGVPYLNTSCVSSCDVMTEMIDFGTFTFNPETGKEEPKN